jgi:RNA polymerase sigma-70 factor (ECF subfamily)
MDDQTVDDALDALWLEDGHWRDKPQTWPTPDGEYERREFIIQLQNCIDKLPARLARVFMMRESLDLDTEEICKDMDITANHCGVLLYRARMQLRECLDQSWARS